MNLETKLKELANKPSDINEHLIYMRNLARVTECKHITELGTRAATSTHAWLDAKPDKLVCYDLYLPDTWGYPVEQLRRFAVDNNIKFEFYDKSSLKTNIEQTDLLFIDTYHKYLQLLSELKRHSNNVAKFIVLHDTTSFEYKDEPISNNENDYEIDNDKQGLMPAIEDFLKTNHDWYVFERRTNNNGLTILARK